MTTWGERQPGEATPWEVNYQRIQEGAIRTDKLYSNVDPPPEAPVIERNAPAMLVLRPGDKVLVCLVDDPPPGEAQEWARQLHTAFRGVEFTIAGGVAGLAVLGGGDRG